MSREARGRWPQGLRLRQGPVTIDVLSDDAGALSWLAEFLGPAFRPGPPGRPKPSHRVVLETSGTRHATLVRRRASAPLQGLQGFTLDGSFSRHRGWRDADHTLWVDDPTYNTFYGVDAAARSLVVVANQKKSRPRLALMRVVRELATTALLGAGRLPVHGAAFAEGRGVVLICGPKKAGKTSLLVHALRSGAVFVSNDRVFVDVGQATATAMPTIVMLRDGTLSRFPALQSAFERARFDRSRTIAECAPGMRRPVPRAGKGFDRPGMSAPQFCRLLGARMRGGGRVSAILFPRVDAHAEGVVLRRLPVNEAARALQKSLLAPSRPIRASGVFSPAGRRGTLPTRVASELCRGLAARVPAFEGRLGPDAYRADLRPLLRRALRATNGPPAPLPRRRRGGR